MHHLLFDLSKDSKYTSENSVGGWLKYLKSVDKESYVSMSNYWERLKIKSHSA